MILVDDVLIVDGESSGRVERVGSSGVNASLNFTCRVRSRDLSCSPAGVSQTLSRVAVVS